ncbi:hypothetical protein C8R44DRAFT_780211 [Mycena epipterygia]|nr:hypothetical protein C8R44DRAFT_780211 [Mycena epipterygia]
MLTKRPRITSLRRAFSRALSSSYSPKVRAYPFELSKEQAITKLGRGVFLHSPTLFDFGIQPEKLVAVYFPAWFIDAELEATVSVSTGEGMPKNTPITAVFMNSYLPGYTGMDKLASISLLSEGLALHKTVPFSVDLETQYDTKITCLPFKTAPFSVLDAAKALRPDQSTINDRIRINPSSIRTNLISAYPVLLPLYLAQYALSTADGVYQTAMIEAYSADLGRVIIENVKGLLPSVQAMRPPAEEPDTLLSGLRRQLYSFMAEPDAEFLYWNGSATPFSNLASITLPITWGMTIKEHALTHWLDHFMTPEALQQLFTTSDNVMEDPRIRPFTEKELKQVRTFFTLGQERTKAHTLLDAMSKVHTTGVAGNDLQEVKDHAASADDRREKAIPSWWKDWQRSTKPPKPEQ